MVLSGSVISSYPQLWVTRLLIGLNARATIDPHYATSMSSKNLIALGKLLSRARRGKGLSLRQVADKVGVTHLTIYHLEQGVYLKPSPQNLQKLARVLDLAVEDLFAKVGYAMPDLPDFAPFLRTKYDLSDDVVAQMERYLARITDTKRSHPRKKRNHDRRTR